MKKLFKQFSFPGGIPSHVAPETPGSINEGGELGYCLSHAYGAAFDNPDLVVACVIGDGEAETGPLATSWHSNKFLNPVHDGAVLPILHLNGHKIAGPTVLARLPHEELDALFRATATRRSTSKATNPPPMHQAMAAALDDAFDRIRETPGAGEQQTASASVRSWPMIVLRSPKGWTGPKAVDGKPVEGTFRSHQVPVAQLATNPAAPRDPRAVAAQLPAAGTVRRGRPPAARHRRPGAARRSPHGRQSACQRRAAAA